MNIKHRLKIERERNGLSQLALSAIVLASRSSIISWERGTAAPNANHLELMASAGLDVQYIITGQRSQPTPHENAVSALYAALSPQQQKEILQDIEEKKRVNELEQELLQLRKKA